MFFLWVRAKRDARKMPMVLKKYYRDEEIWVKTIKARSLAELDSPPFDLSFFNVVLLGSDDKDLFDELAPFCSPMFGLIKVKSPQVRTEKVSAIFRAIELSKSIMRNGITLEASYYEFSGTNKLKAPLELDTDLYILYPGHGRNLEKTLSLDFTIPDFAPVFRNGPLERIYCSNSEFIEVEKPDKNKVRLISAPKKGAVFSDFDFSLICQKNKKNIDRLKEEAVRFLEPYSDKRAVIPLSGGKDSQAVLDIAVNLWDKRKLLCIHADTGFDFDENRLHAEYLCQEYGVDLKLLKLNLHKKGTPDYSRWCTFEKTEQIYAEASRFGADVFLMGDRDAESIKRRRKPRKRMLKGLLHLFPIKFWSAAHIQVLIETSGKRINPLYEQGFWRTGCKACPFLTTWEKGLL